MHRWSTAVLYGLTIAGYPLISAAASILAIDSRSISLIYRAGYLALALAVVAENLRRRRLYTGSLWFLLGVFWLLYSARIFSDTTFSPAALRLAGYEYFLWAFGTCLIPMLAFMSVPDDETLRTSAVVTLITSTVACLLALYVSYKALTIGVSGTLATGRLESETLNPISLGHLGVTTSVMAFALMPGRRKIARLLLTVLIVLGLFTAAAAASRGPIVALVVILLIQFGLWVPGRSLPRVVMTVCVAGVIVFLTVRGAYLLQDMLGFRAVERVVALQDLRADASTALHLEGARNAWTQFINHPILGSGLEETISGDYPHNVVIESFMAIGVVGGLTFCAILAWSCISAARIAKTENTRWISLLFIQQVVAALVSGALFLSGAMWCLAAAVTALACSTRRRGSVRERSFTPHHVTRLPVS
jgi:hypothetical protein